MQSLNYKKWYVLIITIMWVVTLPVSSSQAQQKDLSLLSIRDITGEKLMEPPAIGEKLPDLAFNNLLNYSKSTVNLSEFRGKLLLLDFWATWCTSCIQNFSKLEGFQKQFKGRFQVLLINTEKKDTRQKLIEFFKKRKNKDGQPYKFATTVKDTTTQLYFPHKSVPHYVWIGPDGTLRAITSSTELTATNINAILSDPNFELPVKKDIRTDKPIFLPEDLEMDDLLHYSIMIKGKIDGNSTGISRYRKSGEITRGRILINMPVLSMYKTIAAAAIEGFDDKRMILEITDSSGLSIKNIHKEESLWKYKLYTYDFMVPVSEAGKLHEYMLQDLNKYSAYEGSIRKSPVKCLALVRISETHNLLTKGGKSENKLSDPQNPYLRNLPITILVNRIKKIESISVPIIDETGYTNNIDIDLQSGFNDLLLLRKELNKHGLDLVERVRDLDMLYIKEKEKL